MRQELVGGVKQRSRELTGRGPRQLEVRSVSSQSDIAVDAAVGSMSLGQPVNGVQSPATGAAAIGWFALSV